jgi:hypothetical protein
MVKTWGRIALAIETSTLSLQPDESWRPQVPPDLLEAYTARNAREAELPQLGNAAQVTMLRRARLREIALQDFPDKSLAMQSALPGVAAVVSLSLPGISSDGTEAVVFTNVSSGPLAGAGHVVFLRLEKGEWVLVRRDLVILS